MTTHEKRILNRGMSAVRTSVEHNYKDMKQYWISKDFSRNFKVQKAPMALLYKVSTLVLNFHVCLHGEGKIWQHYDVAAPTLEEYHKIDV